MQLGEKYTKWEVAKSFGFFIFLMLVINMVAIVELMLDIQ